MEHCNFETLDTALEARIFHHWCHQAWQLYITAILNFQMKIRTFEQQRRVTVLQYVHYPYKLCRDPGSYVYCWLMFDKLSRLPLRQREQHPYTPCILPLCNILSKTGDHTTLVTGSSIEPRAHCVIRVITNGQMHHNAVSAWRQGGIIVFLWKRLLRKVGVCFDAKSHIHACEITYTEESIHNGANNMMLFRGTG